MKKVIIILVGVLIVGCSSDNDSDVTTPVVEQAINTVVLKSKSVVETELSPIIESNGTVHRRYQYTFYATFKSTYSEDKSASVKFYYTQDGVAKFGTLLRGFNVSTSPYTINPLKANSESTTSFFIAFFEPKKVIVFDSAELTLL